MARYLPVMDHTKLAHVFQVLASEYGSQAKAAAAIDLSQPMFWARVHARGGPHITDRVYLQLHRLCARRVTHATATRDQGAFMRWDALRNDLEAAVTSPEGMQLINDKWFPWSRTQWGGWETNPLHILRVEQEGGRSADSDLIRTAQQLGIDLTPKPVVQLMHRLLQALLQRGLLSYLQPFVILIESCSHAFDQRRALLAFHQALDPLLNGERTGGIERGWEEMTDAELARYLKAAYTCTAILLERESVLARAAKVTRRESQKPKAKKTTSKKSPKSKASRKTTTRKRRRSP